MVDKKLLKRQKAAEKLLAGVEKTKLQTCGAHIVSDYDGNKYQCFTNGFVGFALKDELPDLQMAEPFNMLKAIEDAERKQGYGIEVDTFTPDLKAIKAHIKKEKAKQKEQNIIEDVYYDIGNHTYNAQYIVDVCEILGGDITFIQENVSSHTPAVLVSENGKAMICPIRKR